MNGSCKLIEDTDKTLVIGYSWEQDRSCDGVLIFDKETQAMTIKKLSASTDEFDTKYLICPIRSVIRRGMQIGKVYTVATG